MKPVSTQHSIVNDACALQGASAASHLPAEAATLIFARARRCVSDFLSFFKWDIPTALFIGSALASGFLLRAQLVDNLLDPKAFFTDLAVFFLLSAVAFLFRPARRVQFYIGISVFFCVVFIGDIFYHRAHGSILSMFLVAQLQFLPQVANTCQILFRWSDLLYVLSTSILIVGMIRLKRNGHFELSRESGRLRAAKLVTSLVVALVILGLFGATLTKMEASRLDKQWNRPFLVEHFGAYGYHVSDMIKYASAGNGVKPVSKKEFDRVVEFFEKRISTPACPNKYTDLLAGQNVVLIHAESVQTMFLFKKMGGVEITPNLNRIASKSLYFDNFYSQHSTGTSSDSEFTLNTSLFPINNGTVFISHFNHTFVTMPWNLKEKGYTNIAMHANNAGFWNRATMNKTLGYDRFYAKRDFVIDEVIGLGLSDMSFFRQALDVLEKTPRPFYATAIMLTNHTPFAETDKYGPFDSMHLEGTRLGNYLKSLHYADKAIGYLFDEIEKRGMMEDTVFVLYGDHPANLPRAEIARFLGLKELRKYDYHRFNTVPFLIHSKKIDEPRTVHTPMGMIDIFPTLGNMLGIENKYALGTDIFSVDTNRVIFPDGSWIDENIQFVNANMKYHIFNEDFIYRYYKENCAFGSLASEDELKCKRFIRRIFKFNPRKRNRNGLVGHAWDYITERNKDCSEYLAVSSKVIDHDLFASRKKGQDYSLTDVDVHMDVHVDVHVAKKAPLPLGFLSADIVPLRDFPISESDQSGILPASL